MIRLGVLGSTRGTDLEAILSAIKNKKLSAEVSVVISNRENAYILTRAKNHDVPSFFISHKNKSREEFDKDVTTILKQYNVELVLLIGFMRMIGFMRILSTRFCQAWRDRVLNVHPSLLPKYAGGMDMNVHEEVLKNGDHETGCTIHLVTETVDGGPILVQKRCTVATDETIATLKSKVQALEGGAFIEAIQLIQNNQYVR